MNEANPIAHPDTVRRQRTLRDAGLAAKAAFSTTESLGGGWGRGGGRDGGTSGGGGVGGGEGEGDDNGSVESGSASRHASGWSTSGLLPLRTMSRTVAIAPGNEGEGEFEEGGKRRRWLLGSGFSTTRVALTSAKWVDVGHGWNNRFFRELFGCGEPGGGWCAVLSTGRSLCRCFAQSFFLFRRFALFFLLARQTQQSLRVRYPRRSFLGRLIGAPIPPPPLFFFDNIETTIK